MVLVSAPQGSLPRPEHTEDGQAGPGDRGQERVCVRECASGCPPMAGGGWNLAIPWFVHLRDAPFVTEFMERVRVDVRISACEDTHTCLCVCLCVAVCAVRGVFLRVSHSGAASVRGLCGAGLPAGLSVRSTGLCAGQLVAAWARASKRVQEAGTSGVSACMCV